MATKVVHNKKEPYDVMIDRTTKWGNPFRIDDNTSRDEAIDKYREWILTQPELLDCLHELEGKVLGCWCKPQRCHGDVLVELIKKRAMSALFE